MLLKRYLLGALVQMQTVASTSSLDCMTKPTVLQQHDRSMVLTCHVAQQLTLIVARCHMAHFGGQVLSVGLCMVACIDFAAKWIICHWTASMRHEPGF